MTGYRIFLLVMGALTAIRLIGAVAPGFFARMVAALWQSRVFRRLMRPYGVLLVAVGGLGLYLARGTWSVQAVVADALSVLLIALGIAMVAGRVLRIGDRLIPVLSDSLVCRVLCTAGGVIGLLLICLAVC